MTVLEQVKEVIGLPIHGHPSNTEYMKIKRLEDIVLHLAREIDRHHPTH
jgi:hypothetical protein